MAARHKSFFIAILTLISLWVIAVTLRRTNHLPNGFSSWSPIAPATNAEHASAAIAHGGDAKTSLDELLHTLAEKEASLASQETLLQHRMTELQSRISEYQSSHSDRIRPLSLISYIYTETPINRRNLQFFIDHGLHASTYFVFTFNGDTDAHLLLPIFPESPNYDPERMYTNIEILRRDNKCYDMGAHGEALLREWSPVTKTWTAMTGEDRGGRKFWEGFDRFILMNASVRGPFMPQWTFSCWTEAFYGLITEKVKLVGMTYNCHPSDRGHVQSMVWALDRIGIKLLMQKPSNDGRVGGIGYWCPFDMPDAIKGELRGTPLMESAGYKATSLELVAHSMDGEEGGPQKYASECQTEDAWHEGEYYGFNIHPYETVFAKAARDMQVQLMGNFTEWTDGSGYSSFERCDGRWEGKWRGEVVVRDVAAEGGPVGWNSTLLGGL